MINTRTRAAALFAGLLTVLAVALSTTSASASTSNYLASNITVTVTGVNVVAKVTIKSKSGSITAKQAGICLMSDELYQESFPLAQNVKISRTGRTVTKSADVPVGRYLYYACIQTNTLAWPAVDGPRGWIDGAGPEHHADGDCANHDQFEPDFQRRGIAILQQRLLLVRTPHPVEAIPSGRPPTRSVCPSCIPRSGPASRCCTRRGCRTGPG